MNSCDDLDGHMHTYHFANGGSMLGERWNLGIQLLRARMQLIWLEKKNVQPRNVDDDDWGEPWRFTNANLNIV